MIAAQLLDESVARIGRDRAQHGLGRHLDGGIQRTGDVDLQVLRGRHLDTHGVSLRADSVISKCYNITFRVRGQWPKSGQPTTISALD